MADLNEAFKIPHRTFSQNSTKTVQYKFKCVFCGSTNVAAITNDGGSIQMCNNCKKSYRAEIVQTVRPVQKYECHDEKKFR
jgi:transcription elongation factor Elf1